MTLPSKKLLTAVLELEVIRIYHSKHWLVFWTLYKNGKEKRNQINIYELANKFKEWVDSRGYSIVSYFWGNDGYAELHYERNFKSVKECNPFRLSTEPEAIFKAAEWILNQQDRGI